MLNYSKKSKYLKFCFGHRSNAKKDHQILLASLSISTKCPTGKCLHFFIVDAPIKCAELFPSRYRARSQILLQTDSKDREKYVMRFIKIMKHLRKINNYNSYLALLSALDSAPIRRYIPRATKSSL